MSDFPNEVRIPHLAGVVQRSHFINNFDGALERRKRQAAIREARMSNFHYGQDTQALTESNRQRHAEAEALARQRAEELRSMYPSMIGFRRPAASSDPGGLSYPTMAGKFGNGRKDTESEDRETTILGRRVGKTESIDWDALAGGDESPERAAVTAR